MYNVGNVDEGNEGAMVARRLNDAAYAAPELCCRVHTNSFHRASIHQSR